MQRISIPVVKCQSLGHTVYRGSVKARELYPALWIDRYDEDANPEGYQRPFNEERSKDAAKYAEEEPNGFWPECVLNIRAQNDDSRATTILYAFNPTSPGSPYGVLTADFDETKVKQFGTEQVPWDRAFSEVDCQHRLGMMMNSEKEVPVCIFERLTLLEEALIFRVINEKQKKISTALVDLLIFRLGKGDLYQPTRAWAMRLDSDPRSPFYQKVWKGGSKVGKTYIVSLNTLHECMKLMLGDDQISDNLSEKQKMSILKRLQNSVIYQTILNPDVPELQKRRNFDKAYEFILIFWTAVKDLWGNEWDPRRFKQYKLLTTPGLKGLSMVGSSVFDICRQKNDYSYHFIDTLLSSAVDWVDWSKDGDFKEATGNAGAVLVRETLRQKIVPVGVL